MKKIWLKADEAGTCSLETICELMETSLSTGLTDSAANIRRKSIGTNEFSETKKESPLSKFAGQFREPLILLLLTSAAVSVFMRQIDDAVVITIAIIIVVSVAFIQELRTDKALEELKKQVPGTCICLRDGQMREYPASQLVPGDIIFLNMGDRVPADTRLVEALDMSVDESSFTGETESAMKTVSLEKSSCRTPSYCNIVYMGTFLRTGRGKGIVINTGEKSQFGELIRMMQDEESPRTPLQRNMDELAKKLSIFSFGFIGVVFALGIYQGIPLQKVFNIAVSLAVAAIPEGLPIVVSLTLCLGTRRMARRSALVKGLHTVETLGCVTTICSDKTGTITKNEMTVTCIMTSDGKFCSVTGVGYGTKGTISIEGGYSEKIYDDVTRLLETGVLCSNAALLNGQLLGQPTEGAILTAAIKHGIYNPSERYLRLEEHPFKSETKAMSVKVKHKKTGEEEWLLKGAWEVVLSRCVFYLDNSRKSHLTPEKISEITYEVREWGSRGLRVICIARGTEPTQLCFLGMLGILDPPRDGVKASIRSLRDTGVDVKMLTGDSEETATAIARAIGLPGGGQCTMSGETVENLDGTALLSKIRDVTIFYRVSPRHKLQIVKALQERSQIVGMTGDGVNDVVALKRANIGIAMGTMGSAVSREAADMILNDDDFTTILAAIEEGKCIFHNISNFIQFQVSTSIVALSLIALSTLFGLPSPLNPMQILLINVIMDGPPALSLGMEPIDEDVKKQQPRDTKKNLVTPELIRNCVISAFIIICGTLWVFRSEMMDGVVTARDTTMTFTCFVLFDMFNALSCRSSTKSILEIGFTTNWYLFLAISATVICLLGVVYLPVLQYIFLTEGLLFSDWLYLTSLTSSVLVVSEIRKFIYRNYDHLQFSRLPFNFFRLNKAKNKLYYGLEAV